MVTAIRISEKDLLVWSASIAPVISILFVWYGNFEVNLTELSFLFFLHVLIIGPALEEIVFRGMFQESLKKVESISDKKIFQLSIANWITSVIFAVMHYLVLSTPLALLMLFPSLVLGHLKDTTGQLNWPIVMHIHFNLCWILAMYFLC